MLITKTRTPGSIVRPPFPARRWSVVEHEQLSARGILTANDRVKLLEGWIVRQMTHSAPHESSMQRLVRRRFPLLGNDWDVRVQSAITTRDSVPEPDVAVVTGPAGRFDHQRPGVSEVQLVVEVADTTLRKDREKLRLYSDSGIPCDRIVDLRRRKVEVHSQPDPDVRKSSVSCVYEERASVPLSVSGKVIGKVSVESILPAKGKPAER